MRKDYLILILFLTHAAFAKSSATVSSNEIFGKLQSLNKTREALASTIDSKTAITEETFRNVCQPVGKELQRWSKEMNLQSRQLSHKNRNEKNAIPKDLEGVYKEFEKNPDLVEKIIPYTMEGVRGEMHLYRIPVIKACLNCHGEKSARPAFIKEKYPLDKAYAFKAGDLRGVYSVFLTGN